MSEWEKLARTIRIQIWLWSWVGIVWLTVSQLSEKYRIESCADQIIAAQRPFADTDAQMERCLRYGIVPVPDEQ